MLNFCFTLVFTAWKMDIFPMQMRVSGFGPKNIFFPVKFSIFPYYIYYTWQIEATHHKLRLFFNENSSLFSSGLL